MHPCTALLEKIIALCRVEERALADEDIDKVEELSRERADLLREVWEVRAGYPDEELHAALLRIKDEQTRLGLAAEALHRRLREQQQASRKQSRYFNQDRHLNAQNNRAFYCDKIS